MEILMFGSVISDAMTDEILSTSKVRPSPAPINFQRNLLKGMADQSIEVHSLPPVASFPNSKKLAWGSRMENISDNISCRLIPSINLPVLKQLSVFFSTLGVLTSWTFRHRKDKHKVILQYGQYAYFAIPIVFWSKLFHIKNCNIVTDPISYASDFEHKSPIKKLLLRLDWGIAERIKKKFDSYVFLTKYFVSEYDAANKPHIILEGIADAHIFDAIPEQAKAQPPVIMYAGALSKGFGIPALLEAVQNMRQDCQLWLYGDGDCVAQIKAAGAADGRVTYCGKVPRQELLISMKKATVLVSTKPVAADHTKYQFPSKIMEYMVSGSPVAATAVLGIPDEYFQHIYKIEPDTAAGIQQVLEEVLSYDAGTMAEMADNAKKWVEQNKTYVQQSKRVSALLETVAGQENCYEEDH